MMQAKLNIPSWQKNCTGKIDEVNVLLKCTLSWVHHYMQVHAVCTTRCRYILCFAEDLFDVFKYAVLWLRVQLGDHCLAIVCKHM